MGLIERGIPRDRLFVLELDGPMHAYLKERLPGVNVVQGDATRLDEILVRHGVDSVSTVISGIPMVGNPIELRRAIVGQGMKVVRPGGFMLQYSYSPIAPIPAKDFGVKAKLARYVFWNFPPASVWRYTPQGGPSHRALPTTAGGRLTGPRARAMSLGQIQGEGGVCLWRSRNGRDAMVGR